jgi:hypothetical protein
VLYHEDVSFIAEGGVCLGHAGRGGVALGGAAEDLMGRGFAEDVVAGTVLKLLDESSEDGGRGGGSGARFGVAGGNLTLEDATRLEFRQYVVGRRGQFGRTIQSLEDLTRLLSTACDGCYIR